MLSDNLLHAIKYDDAKIDALADSFDFPSYDPKTHYVELTTSAYYRALLVMRHYIKSTSDHYFSLSQNAKNIDLFMFTPSVSSPMGPGSDSEVVPITFGNLQTNLVDSSQFGFEPLVMNGFDKVYCYLPSMRGEVPDERHLNQFFHCEAEIAGTIETLFPIVENYIKTLSTAILTMPSIVQKISRDPDLSVQALKAIVHVDKFKAIEFDQAVNLLKQHGLEACVNESKLGCDINNEGERALFKILNISSPLWIKNYDRDRVAFYQKPHSDKPNKVINADLLFPALLEDSFGGEILGAGQRQDNPSELLESLSRQKIDSSPYEWYINLRKLPYYRTTSGFGLGIERFITWALCRSDIKEVIPYPRLKNIVTYP